jgi:hypothetical protein
MHLMKTVRFSQVVKKAGKPSTYLQLVPVGKDRTLKGAASEDRVMTVSQATVGHAADYGVVGLDAKLKGQVLIFPRSLAKFEGSRVVGIKYEMLEPPSIPKSALATVTGPAERKANARRKKASSKKHTAAERTKNARAMLRAAAAAPEEEPGDEAPRSQPRKNPRRRSTSGSHKQPAASTHLRTGIEEAIQALEDGQSVKAYKLLKGLLKEEE